jgi:hypothetical protein
VQHAAYDALIDSLPVGSSGLPCSCYSDRSAVRAAADPSFAEPPA